MEIHPSIEIVPSAVCDKEGKAIFYANPLGRYTEEEKKHVDLDSGSNTLFERPSLVGFEKIEVQTTTIDQFVKNMPGGGGRVDFIKADIEGAERYMLMGAKETLAKFAPKLALCTYHLKDDPQVMEKLILEANPNYIIEHRWQKLYAYVEKGNSQDAE